MSTTLSPGSASPARTGATRRRLLRAALIAAAGAAVFSLDLRPAHAEDDPLPEPSAPTGDAGMEATPAEAPAEPAPVEPAAPAPAYAISYGPGASLGGRRPFPDDNPWNQDVSREPVDPSSDALIASIGLDRGLHPDFGTVWEGAPIGIPYVVVPGTQPGVPVRFEYADESDRVPYPVPLDAPIEGGPTSDGDRHILMVDADNWMLYELFAAYPDGPSGPNGPARWRAGSGAGFNLNNNELRPAGWTSAVAAGLPIFPGLVRYDETVEQGAIRHALRFTARRTRRAYVPPARHYASRITDPNVPPMGMRVRLKSSFDVSGFPRPVQVILQAMKTYGMLLADNGSDWYVSGAPDPRWNDDQLATLRRVRGRDFEVVKMGPLTTG
jgi:hypothetical protein